MLNFKESVAKVKSAPNFGKMTTIGILSSLGIFSTFFFYYYSLILMYYQKAFTSRSAGIVT